MDSRLGKIRVRPVATSTPHPPGSRRMRVCSWGDKGREESTLPAPWRCAQPLTHTRTCTQKLRHSLPNTKPDVTAVIPSHQGSGRGNRNALHLSQRMSQNILESFGREQQEGLLGGESQAPRDREGDGLLSRAWGQGRTPWSQWGPGLGRLRPEGASGEGGLQRGGASGGGSAFRGAQQGRTQTRGMDTPPHTHPQHPAPDALRGDLC